MVVARILSRCHHHRRVGHGGQHDDQRRQQLLNVTIDGAATTITIANGTYTQQQLADAVETASAGKLTTTVTNGGLLQVSTVKEGSAHTLQVTGGNAHGVLGSAPAAA